MQAPPEIRTARLALRPFRAEDAPAVAELAGDRDVASTTASLPHPYPPGTAEAWIASHPSRLEMGTEVIFAVTRRGVRPLIEGSGGRLLGAAGLIIDRANERAEMGYWIGKPHWGKGYATEAVRALVAFGFEELGLHRIFAHHMTRNPASGRVLEKAGLKFEGELRQHFLKWGAYEDARVYGILKEEYLAASAGE